MRMPDCGERLLGVLLPMGSAYITCAHPLSNVICAKTCLDTLVNAKAQIHEWDRGGLLQIGQHLWLLLSLKLPQLSVTTASSVQQILASQVSV